MPSTLANPQLAARMTEQVRVVELTRRRKAAQRLRQLATYIDPLDLSYSRQAIRLVVASQQVSAHQAVAYLNAYVEALGGSALDLKEALQVDVGYSGRAGQSVAHVRRKGERYASVHGREQAKAWTSRQQQRVAADLTWMAFRDTVHAGVELHPEVIGYRRVPSPLACGACLALATGEVLEPGTVFRAHPACRCGIEPVLKDADLVHRPTGRDLFDRMSAEEQDRHFGREKAALLRSGDVAFEDLISRPKGGIGRLPLVTETPLHRLQPK
jgi:hypothetical protein